MERRKNDMIIGKVVGTVVATKKDERLVGNKLLIIRPLGTNGQFEGATMVVVDAVGAGIGEVVLICRGSSARKAVGVLDSPVDAAIVGIVDTMEVEDQ